MKITKKSLENLIKEQIEKALQEQDSQDPRMKFNFPPRKALDDRLKSGFGEEIVKYNIIAVEEDDQSGFGVDTKYGRQNIKGIKYTVEITVDPTTGRK